MLGHQRLMIKSAVTDVLGLQNIIDLQRVPIKFFDNPKFPQPSGININMMPFISSDQFENCRLPEDLKPYWGLIKYCVKHEQNRNVSSTGKVFYLSIEESEVEVGFAQRQPGLHVDRPRRVKIAMLPHPASQVSFTAYCKREVL